MSLAGSKVVVELLAEDMMGWLGNRGGGTVKDESMNEVEGC
jgi:hypothetical protein